MTTNNKDLKAFFDARRRVRDQFQDKVDELINMHLPNEDSTRRQVLALKIKNAFLEYALTTGHLEQTKLELQKFDLLESDLPEP